MITMTSNGFNVKRHCLILPLNCLVLVVLYHFYFLGDRHSEDVSGLRGSLSPAEIDNHTELISVPVPTPPAQVPPEYVALSKGQQECDLFFTTSYLDHIATHQQPYCDAQSLSAFHCFTAPRLNAPFTAGWGETDPLCVAQGVSFEHQEISAAGDNQVQTKTGFNINCKLRDLASERASSSEAAAELRGFRDRPSDWGWYWGDTGVGASLNTWHFTENHSEDDLRANCTKDKSNPHDWIMLMRRDSTDTHNLWHKLMEIIQARHSFDALRIANNQDTGAPWLSENDAPNVQLVLDDDREELLDELWEIVTGNRPIRLSSLKQSSGQVPNCFGNVILPLPGCGSPFWSKLLAYDYKERCQSQTLLTTFVNRVFEFYAIEPRTVDVAAEIHQYPTITIVQRTTNRKFIEDDLTRWLSVLQQRYPQSPINVVDFGKITMQEQLRLVQGTDILIGHHGAAMAHTIFMTPEATVVEILPRYFNQHGFRAMAAMRGVNYIAGRQLYEEEYENAVHGKPLPLDWPPPPPQDFNHFQTQEWVYLTDDDFLGLVDAAVRTQMNKLSSSDI